MIKRCIQALLRRVVGPLARFAYGVRAEGLEHLPPGGCLLLPNHCSYIDWLLIQCACPRPIRFVVHEDFYTRPMLSWFLRLFDVLPISSVRAKDSLKEAIERLKAGDLVCIFPEGQISRVGTLLRLERGFTLLARRSGAPVVPVAIDSAWGSRFSFYAQSVFFRRRAPCPRPIRVVFGGPIPAAQADTARVRRVLTEMGAEAYARRREFRGHLARQAVLSLCRRPWRTLVVDTVPTRREASAGRILAAAIVLSRRWARTCPQPRIGIVLTPGIGACVANLAAMLAGKTPVNLNFSIGRDAALATLRRSGVELVVTVDPIRQRFPDFPWPEHTVDLRAELAAAGGRRAVLPWLAAASLLPGWVLARVLRLPREGGEREAALIFTSGSSGEPKAAVLSHRNILGNCRQVDDIGLLTPECVIVGCLPVFHSFGFTVTMWYPILHRSRLVAVPSPLDTKKIADAIEAERASVLITAPTFLRPFLGKAEVRQLRSLRFAVTGAEKLPQDLANAFQERFHVPLLEGYGLTEASPVVSVSLPAPRRWGPHSPVQETHRPGSTGRLLPGLAAKVVDPETGAEAEPGEQGVIHLKGVNVFEGYLGEPEKTAAILSPDRWLATADLGKMDEDGFLYIEGRVSRFSKIGGEMVPHGTLEQKVAEAFGWLGAERPRCVVVGVPDDAKGERIVLLCTENLRLEELRARLAAAGVPNLWIPKVVLQVPEVPVLGTGKLDLRRCTEIARAGG